MSGRSAAPSPVNAPRSDARFEVQAEMRRDVRLLGGVLGRVLREYGGDSLYRDVEQLRRAALDAHEGDEDAQRTLDAMIAGFDWERATEVARAFTVYFQLVNVADETQRVRTLREEGRTGPLVDSLSVAVAKIVERSGPEHLRTLLSGLSLHPVLTAHPTEARRRAVVTAIRRIGRELVRLDDPLLTRAEERDVNRRLFEEVDLLWRTAPLRLTPPTPLDEVRTAMAVFDETLFDLVPVLYRTADAAIGGHDAGSEAPLVRPFLQFGSWIGADRDGNPNVTADVTAEAMAIQAEHALRALEQGTFRVGRMLSVDAETTPPSPTVRRIVSHARAAAPDVVREITLRSPGEPHRQALLVVAERVRATRERNADLAYEGPDALLADLRAVQGSLVAAGATRQAYGELQHLLWQVETFGFHLAELEVRQHSEVHAAAVAEVRAAKVAEAQGRHAELSERTEEVLATIRVMARLQRRFGEDACRRYIVSFTRNAADVAAVYELAEYALSGAPMALDVIPLFETEADLDHCVDVLEEVLRLPQVAHRLLETGRRMEVMLGYSDSAKDVGPVSAMVALNRAQERLAAWAQRHALALTLFHGRGGALGRGGGPAHRAVLAQAPGSVAGRFKVTEQGEVIVARYGSIPTARRHLDRLAAATLLASSPEHEERAAEAQQRHGHLIQRLSDTARATYLDLVHTEGFADWFAEVSPLAEIGTLKLGSRPARRGLFTGRLEDLRAIPWVFAWSQTRVNLPGWFGLGAGLASVEDDDQFREALRDLPVLAVALENWEMSLAKSDRRIMVRYLERGGREDLTTKVLTDYDLAVARVRDLTGRPYPLANRPRLARALALRNPYVAALSHLQIRALGAIRGGQLDEADEVMASRLLGLTINGVAAGLQNTG